MCPCHGAPPRVDVVRSAGLAGPGEGNACHAFAEKRDGNSARVVFHGWKWAGPFSSRPILDGRKLPHRAFYAVVSHSPDASGTVHPSRSFRGSDSGRFGFGPGAKGIKRRSCSFRGKEMALSVMPGLTRHLIRKQGIDNHSLKSPNSRKELNPRFANQP